MQADKKAKEHEMDVINAPEVVYQKQEFIKFDDFIEEMDTKEQSEDLWKLNDAKFEEKTFKIENKT